MKRLVVAFLVLYVSPLPAGAADISAKVVGMSDGDTLTVLTADKVQIKVRLHGIDAPESGQDFGSRAKQAASDLAFGKTVTVRERDKDRYGRTVAEVILPDGRDLGRELVGAGLAWWYRAYAPDDHELARLEAEARAAQCGLWSQPGAVPPWEWRRGAALPPGVAGSFVGNRRSRVYHRLGCPAVVRMAGPNRVPFATAEAAAGAGYRAAKDCQPGR